jgi:YD repeat-containing protein
MKKIATLTASLILVACPILGHATTYIYDNLNRVTKATYTNGDSVAYSYDAGGNITALNSTAKDKDHDNDGLPDSWETEHHLDSNKANTTDDNDQDGLSNLDEYKNNTNPSKKDTDGDGVDDKWELANGMKPTVVDAQSDSNKNGYTNLQDYLAQKNPKLDTDHDGMFDIDEIKYKTNPNDGTDCPKWYCHGNGNGK